MAKLKLNNTVGGVKLPPTKRLKLGDSLWVDLIHANPANQLFRERMVKYKGVKSIEDLLKDNTEERDENDKIRADLVEILFDLCVHDWGSWEKHDDPTKPRKATKLYDDDGNGVPCTLTNFTQVVTEVDGGEEVFFGIMRVFRNQAWFNIKQTEEEKNFLRPSPPQSTRATSRPIRKGRKRAAA